MIIIETFSFPGEKPGCISYDGADGVVANNILYDDDDDRYTAMFLEEHKVLR